jgi:hypothetical protein
MSLALLKTTVDKKSLQDGLKDVTAAQQVIEQQVIEQQVYKAVQLTLKFGRWSSSVMLSQARSESQAGPGLAGCWERSSTCPPFKKNCHSSLFTWEADCRIRTHIWSDSSSLWRSNNPLRQNTKALVSSCYHYLSTYAAGVRTAWS